MKGCVANGKIAKNILFCRFSKKWYYECLGDIIIPSEKKGRFVMKALSVSRLCLVCALILGFLAAWSVATPQRIVGEFSVGSDVGCKCSTTSNETCDSTEGNECNEDHVACDHSGDSECERQGSSSCYLRDACVNQANEMCI